MHNAKVRRLLKHRGFDQMFFSHIRCNMQTDTATTPLAFSRSLTASFGVYFIDFLLSIQSLYLYDGVAAGVRREDLLLLMPLSRLL